MFQPLAADTPAHVEAAVIAALRLLSPARKLELARDMNRMADRLALAGIQRRKPAASAHELGYALALQRLTPEQRPYGAALLQGLALMPTPVDPLALALRVGAFLDAQAIPYLVVGSVAAVVHGEYRTTRDIDPLRWHSSSGRRWWTSPVSQAERCGWRAPKTRYWRSWSGTNWRRPTVSGATCRPFCGCRTMRSITPTSASGLRNWRSPTYWRMR